MTAPQCPVCDGETTKVDIPKRNVYTCKDCHELVQVVADGSIIPIGEVLDRNAMGDDRVRAVISTPRARTVASFLDVLQGQTRSQRYEEDATISSLAEILAQCENRMDFAIAKLSGPALIHEEVGDALTALTEVRQRISIRPPLMRGVRKDDIDDGPMGSGESSAEDGLAE